MRCILFCLSFLFATVSFAKTFVAVVETKADGDVLTVQEKMFLTDELRRIANMVFLGNPDYVIMTRENINVMLPEGKSIEDCEGDCLAETGRNITADYIAQARVGRFSDMLSLTVEMYESGSGKLVSSFTGQSDDAKGLLKDINTYAEGFFRKVRRGDGARNGGRDGFSDVSSGSDYSVRREKSFIVQIESDPEGALLSVDGDPVSNCKETPCKIQLRAGDHRFSLVKDQYFKKDSIIRVSGGAILNFSMKPRFGILDVAPSFETRAFVDGDEIFVSIDDEIVSMGKNRLDPGTHRLEIRHRCYEPLSAKVQVNVGSKLTFDKMMKVAKGGLSLSAIRGEEPVEEPVYINGKYAGVTPFTGDVPVCAAVTIGENREEVPVAVPYHDEVSYTYEFDSYAPSSGYEYSYRELDDDYSPAPRAIESKIPSESTDESTEGSGESSSYFQVLLGAGLDFPASDSDFDGSGLNFMLGLYYAEVFWGWKFDSGYFISFGAGLGIHDPVVMDSSSSDGYGSYYGGLTEDEANEMLPSASAALLLSIELGKDFKLENDLDAAFGFRLNAVISSWPAYSLNLFFEALSWFGMEMGVTSVTGDELWSSGLGLSIRMYLRFPSRPKF